MTAAPNDTDPAWHSGISRYQWSVLVATTLGWALDGFDYSLFTQVAGPATTELLGEPSTFYSGLAVTIFLTGWAVGAIFFGVVADYVGRVRVLITGVLLFSVFTALSVVVVNYAEFVTFRFIAGIGSGVELPIGAALVAEAWSSSRHRAKASGVMMSGLALGALLAAVVYNFVGHLGWRWTMAFGLIPALLVLFIRRNVHEPETMAEVKATRARRKVERAAGAAKQGSDRFVLTQLFTPPMLKTTVACTLICVGALFAFWGVSTWTPQNIRAVVADDGVTDAAVVTAVAWGTAMLNIGGAIGYASWGFIADRIGRKNTFVMSLVVGLARRVRALPIRRQLRHVHVAASGGRIRRLRCTRRDCGVLPRGVRPIGAGVGDGGHQQHRPVVHGRRPAGGGRNRHRVVRRQYRHGYHRHLRIDGDRVRRPGPATRDPRPLPARRSRQGVCQRCPARGGTGDCRSPAAGQVTGAGAAPISPESGFDKPIHILTAVRYIASAADCGRSQGLDVSCFFVFSSSRSPSSASAWALPRPRWRVVSIETARKRTKMVVTTSRKVTRTTGPVVTATVTGSPASPNRVRRATPTAYRESSVRCRDRQLFW